MSSYKTIAIAVGSTLSNEESLSELIASLELVMQVFKKKGLGRLLQNSLIKLEDRVAVLKKLISLFALSQHTEELVTWLIKNKKVEDLSKIITVLKELRKKQYHTVEGEIITVKTLASHEKAAIQKLFEGLVGNKLILKSSTNPDILGGVIMKSGDMLFDASISKQLQTLTKVIENSNA